MTDSKPPQPGTATTPDEEKGGDDDPDLAKRLLWCKAGQLFPLLRSAKTLSIGSDPDAQICISSPYVSLKHGRLVVTRPRWSTRTVWTMQDLGSKNGTFLAGERLDEFPIPPGTTFLLGAQSNRMLALDDEMHRRYPELVDILGDESEHPVGRADTSTPCDVILAARNNDNVLIVSEPHCEQTRLARIIHAISHLRDREPVERRGSELPTDGEGRKAFKKLAERSTLVLDLGDDDQPLDKATLEGLFRARNRIRVIVLATHEDTAFRALRGRYSPRQRIELRPLAKRPEAIPRLLDHALEEEGSALRAAFLTTENRQALQRAAWPENFASLREVAHWLALIVRHGSAHQAAIALGVTPSVFYRWLRKLGLNKPFAPAMAGAADADPDF